MEKESKQEEIIKLFNQSMLTLKFYKVSFKEWYNINNTFEKAISENQLNTNLILRYATILSTSKVLFLHNEDVKIFLEKTKQLERLVEIIIIKKAKSENYDDRKEIYQEVYLKEAEEQKTKLKENRKGK